MADDLRLLNWTSNLTPPSLLPAPPVAAPEVAPPPVAPAFTPDALSLTSVAPAPDPLAVPAVPADPAPQGPRDWAIPGLRKELAALTPEAPAPAPAPAPVAPAAPPPPPKPKAEKPKPKPKPKPAPAPVPPKPPVDTGAQYAAKLRSHLHGEYYQTPTGCFRYAWHLVALSGGRSIGQCTISRDARGQSPAYLAQMIKDGRLKVGDIIYINNKPGADPTSTILSYKPHWFTYIGNGQFADQYGERDAAGMNRMFYGRKIDTIYHTN